jgi:CheY-like chemotaxis protein
MGYQALLFCPDEKLARVVAQVFTELDFKVEPVNEPFAAVKKLMAQRYDAVVVDCENEQNATLLFKSARNSSFNQSSLALALVEGQAGVAKAYRIGANLVLTKPINVEQAKGTLRVARGLLRKNADSTAPSTSSTTPPASTLKADAAPTASSSRPQSPSAEPVVNASNLFDAHEIESALPAMAASAEKQENPAAEPAPWSKISVDAEPTIQLQHQSIAPEPQKPVAAGQETGRHDDIFAGSRCRPSSRQRSARTFGEKEGGVWPFRNTGSQRLNGRLARSCSSAIFRSAEHAERRWFRG